MSLSRNKLIIIGASGHGKVICDIALKNDYEVLGFLDDDTTKKECMGYPVLGTNQMYKKYTNQAAFVIGIGNNKIRENIASCMWDATFVSLIHPTAVIGMNCTIEQGTVIMANAVVNPCTFIGKHAIINTGAVIEHDNRLGDFVHISPKAALAGTVCVGERTQVGIGAVVKNNLTITQDCIIGAGAAVVKNIEKSGVYMGIPAKERT